MMNTFRTIVLLMSLLLCSVTALSQHSHCAELEQQYADRDRIKDPVLIEETFLSLCNCYLEEIRVALDNHNCKNAEIYYAKYKTLSNKTDAKLEQRIEDCKNPTGVLELEGNKNLLKNAEVCINGNKVSDPATPQNLKPGRYTLSVVHSEYDPFEKDLIIEECHTTKIKVPFACHGILRIEGDDALLSRAIISLDGEVISNPPINSDKRFLCGAYTLCANLKGHKSFEKVVTIEKGMITKVRVDLPIVVVEKYGYLKMEEETGILSSCSAFIDDKKCSNPTVTQKLKCGTYTIRIEHDGYDTFTSQVRISEGETTSLHVVMVPRKCEGSFKIDAGKDNAILEKATVYFDGKTFSNFTVGTRYKTSCGSHSIRIEHKDYKPIEGELLIEKGQTKMFNVNFPTKGLLKLEGDEYLLSKATITIDDKKVKYSAGKIYELSIGEQHSIKIELEKYKTFSQKVTINGKETKILKVPLQKEYVNVTLKVEGKADILVDGTKQNCTYRDGYTTATACLKVGEYFVRCKKRGWIDSKRYYEITETTEKILLKAPRPYENFITGNVAFNNNLGRPSFGVTYGRLLTNSYGLYTSCMTNRLKIVQSDEVCDGEGYLSDGSLPNYVAQESARWSLVFGGFFRLENVYLKLGLGLGARNLYWKAEDGTYYRNIGYGSWNKVGVDYTAGIQYHVVGRFVISFDVVTNEFRTTDFKIGLGGSF